MKKLLLLILLTPIFQLYSQDNLSLKKGIYVNLVATEYIEQAVNDGLFSITTLTGLGYLMPIKGRLYAQGRVVYANRIIDDDCNTCADHFAGYGHLKELEAEAKALEALTEARGQLLAALAAQG